MELACRVQIAWAVTELDRPAARKKKAFPEQRVMASFIFFVLRVGIGKKP